MKKGDVVTIDDYSWCTQINEDTRDCKKQYIIVETECSFPLNDGQYERYRSDTVIQAVNGNGVILIHRAFLRPVPPKHTILLGAECKDCVIVGTWVEISDKLYQEIKREVQ